ncbi:MAG: tyrosine--tRNA ligase [Oscillospiraceae bacterium]|nr:tyrosine--tRNA ligase [Oscillospiraceae bacterium]
MMTIFEELEARGLIAQMTHPEKIKNMLENEQVTFYIGFDATADSLHVGHFLQLIIMKRLQDAGHKPIAMLGTGTTMIGDPTGKTDMRKMLTVEEIDYNAECFKRQMSKFIDFSDGKALLLKNGDWLRNVNYIDFLRKVGVHFSVNVMLAAECFKTRLERGLSFIEFNYMLMQSYDFLHLFDNYGCKMEMGGNDQWANIIGGVDLVRKVHGEEVCGMTFTLLTTKEGKKMGKTEKGAVWLDAEKTSPYDFFQYWRNIDDGDVINCLKMLTFLSLDEIAKYEKLEGSELNAAKEVLAYELTSMVHGKEEAEKALKAAKELFENRNDSEHMPSVTISKAEFADNKIDILTAMVLSNIAPSKSEARRLVMQNAVSLDDVKITNANELIDLSAFDKGYVVLKKGKKTFMKLIVE